MMEGAEAMVVVEGFEVRYEFTLTVPIELHSSHGLTPGKRWVAKFCYPLPTVVAKREEWPMRWQKLLETLGAERLGYLGLILLWQQVPLALPRGFHISLEAGKSLSLARLLCGRDQQRIVMEPHLEPEEIGSNHSIVCFCLQ